MKTNLEVKSTNELRKVFLAEMCLDSIGNCDRLNRPILSQSEVISSMTIPILKN